MSERTNRFGDILYKFSTPLLLSLMTWVFWQFWDTAKSLENRVSDLRIEVQKQNEECRIGLINIENIIKQHVLMTELKTKVAQ